MELSLEKLPVGPLKRGSLRLDSDITVIFGKPNSGKSYLLRTIHSLKICEDVDAVYTFFRNLEDSLYDIKDAVEVELIENGGSIAGYLVKGFVEEFRKAVLDSFVQSYSTLLPADLLSSIYERTCLPSVLGSSILEVSGRGTISVLTEKGRKDGEAGEEATMEFSA